MFRPLSVVLVVLCALSACGGGGGGGAAERAVAPVAEAVSTTSTVVDEWAVPEPVTPEYVERVLTELLTQDAALIRRVAEAGVVEPDVIAEIERIYTDDLSPLILNDLSTRIAIDGERFRHTKDPVVDSVAVNRSGPSCISGITVVDFGLEQDTFELAYRLEGFDDRVPWAVAAIEPDMDRAPPCEF